MKSYLPPDLATLHNQHCQAQERPERISLDQAVTFGQENNRQILLLAEKHSAYKERWVL